MGGCGSNPGWTWGTASAPPEYRARVSPGGSGTIPVGCVFYAIFKAFLHFSSQFRHAPYGSPKKKTNLRLQTSASARTPLPACALAAPEIAA